MYTGTINNVQKTKPVKYRTEYQMTGFEETNVNGAIIQKLVTKTIDLGTNRNIRTRDFDIVNLASTGAINTLKDVTMSRPLEQIANAAEIANATIEEIDFINELNNEPN